MRMLLVLTMFLLAFTLSAAEIRGRVTAVSDGDTLTVLDDLDGGKFRVRLYGIDAPEKRQRFGAEARDHLSGLVLKKPVIIRYREIDRYGRIIGKVFLSGKDIGLMMLESGFAWHYSRYDNSADYIEAERSARIKRRGLWQDDTPVKPEDFRHHR